MSRTTDTITPLTFLQVLRQVGSPPLPLANWLLNESYSCAGQPSVRRGRSSRTRTWYDRRLCTTGYVCFILSVPALPLYLSYQITDAEECFGQIINTLRNVPGLPASAGSSSAETASAGATETKKFVEQYLMGQMRRELSSVPLTFSYKIANYCENID